ncbi:MAG: thioredoxin family protein [Holophagales bacterium]|nr:thioredoxin family protein [Holophagales bacterium]
MRSPRKPFTRSRFLLALLAAVVSAPLAATAAPPAAAKPTVPGAPKPTLVFFMNPAGSPCQTQDGILKANRAQWEPLATLRYVRTDVAADREVFNQYGVRSLPNLILVGADGKEIHRYSPGIQSAETILSGIREKPSR